MPDHGGNQTYDLWASIPKVVGSISTVVRHRRFATGFSLNVIVNFLLFEA
jgi:hypothetical protein